MIDVEIEDEAWTKALPDCEAVVVRAALATLSACEPPLNQAVRPDSSPTGGKRDSSSSPSPFMGDGAAWDVTVLLTDNDAVHALNAQYRGKDSPTNVLSFPAPQTARPHLGDICLAYGVCLQEARTQKKTLQAHLAHLTTHGVLHLLGYDHETEAEAEDMEGLERAILAGLGLPDPYETDVQR